jgi:3-oxoacyl-[acyl-carrier protein] reductase
MSTNATKKLAGRVALVTGGSRGIGAAIAKRLAADGADVAISYAASADKAQAVVRELEAIGVRAAAFQADQADSNQVANLVKAVAKHFGRLDILVNNAGIAVIKPLEQFSLADFDQTVAVNVRGVFVAAQEASRHMSDGGRIITIGSVNADRMPFAGGSVYAMSKAAVAGLTRGLARDLGSRGITVNNVQPGPVATDLNPENGAFAETMKGFMALPRYGQGAEIADMVSYLAGPEAGFVTGASLTIDGGFSA